MCVVWCYYCYGGIVGNFNCVNDVVGWRWDFCFICRGGVLVFEMGVLLGRWIYYWYCGGCVFCFFSEGWVGLKCEEIFGFFLVILL